MCQVALLYSIGSWLKPMPGRPALLNDVESVPPVARLLDRRRAHDADVLERLQELADDRGRLRRAEDARAARAARAGVDVQVRDELRVLGLLCFERAEVLLHVCLRSEEALFLAAPQRDADRAPWLDANRLEYPRGFHHHRAADRVVGGAGCRVPRVEVAAEHDDFVLLVRPGDLGNRVVGGFSLGVDAC